MWTQLGGGQCVVPVAMSTPQINYILALHFMSRQLYKGARIVGLSLTMLSLLLLHVLTSTVWSPKTFRGVDDYQWVPTINIPSDTRGGTLNVMVIATKMKSVTWVQILDKAVCVSLHTLGKGMNPSVLSSVIGCPVGWGCRILQLLLCRGVRPPNECPGYDTKQSDGEVPVMLELWGMQSTPLLPSLPGPLWPRVVAPDKGPI